MVFVYLFVGQEHLECGINPLVHYFPYLFYISYNRYARLTFLFRPFRSLLCIALPRQGPKLLAPLQNHFYFPLLPPPVPLDLLPKRRIVSLTTGQDSVTVLCTPSLCYQPPFPSLHSPSVQWIVGSTRAPEVFVTPLVGTYFMLNSDKEPTR